VRIAYNACKIDKEKFVAAQPEVSARFRYNLARVENLVSLFTDLGVGKGSGRRSTSELDILRAAVVLLHASFEDLIRSTEQAMFTRYSDEIWKTVKFSGLTDRDPDRDRLTVCDLRKYMGRSIDDLIDETITDHLNKKSYNHIEDLTRFLQAIGVKTDPYKAHFPSLSNLIKRRHHIVHQADKQSATVQGKWRATEINVTTVQTWIAAVRGFGDQLEHDL
jgi:hypothetical protein